MCFEDAFKTSDDLIASKEIILELANTLTHELGPVFNRKHGVEHGDGYWRLLLMPWVLEILQTVWKRYKHVEKFVDKHSAENLTADIWVEDIDWKHADAAELHSRILSTHSFNFWLTSKCLEALAPTSWTLRRISCHPDIPGPVSRRESALKTWLRSLYYDQRCRRVYGFRLSSFLISFWLLLLPRKNQRPRSRPTRTCAELESSLPNHFVDLYRRILWQTIPDSLDTAYAQYENMAARRRYRQGKINLLGPVLLLSDSDKFLMAHAHEKGELIVCTQHGSSGFQEINIGSAEVENKQDALFTWGWTEQADDEGRFIPLPSPLYAPYVDRHKEKHPTLCLVGTSARIFAHRLETQFQPSQAIAYRKEKRVFLEALEDRIFENTVYRPYPSDNGVLRDREYLVEHFPELRIHDRDLHSFLFGCRLQVVDHYGTTMAIGLAANVPTMGYWNKGVWGICRQAEAVFAGLERAGIVHKDAASAAKHVNRVWSDVSSWWQADETQDARLAFLESYGRIDRFALLKWLGALKTL